MKANSVIGMRREARTNAESSQRLKKMTNTTNTETTMIIIVDDHMSLLGKRAKDKVTGMEGVVTSVCIDLYGCVQMALNPGIDKDGKARETSWYDSNRLDVTQHKLVMEAPTFTQRRLPKDASATRVHDKGPAEKPAPKS